VASVSGFSSAEINFLGIHVWDVSFGMSVLGCRFWDVGFGMSVLGCRFWDVGFPITNSWEPVIAIHRPKDLEFRNFKRKMDISMTRRTAFSQLATRSAIALSLGSVLLGSVATPSWAGDPFGRGKPIGDKTEAVFKAIFEEGNYLKAKELLPAAKQAEPDEPLIHALDASLSFAESQKENDTTKGNKDEFLAAAQRTQASAQKLTKTDEKRGKLYLAVGNFLESAHIIAVKGIVSGTPDALGKLTNAFQYLGEAESNDPEYSLIKGSMDLMLAVNVNLPLSDANAAVDRVQNQAAPKYVADRVLAWGFRDMNKLDDALKAVNRAIQVTPNNPDLYYLRGQILVKQNKKSDSVPDFKRALSEPKKLPDSLKAQFCNDLRQVDPSAAKEKCGS
jgi:tetratricopeptide (TPR) repeat protein